MKRTLKHMLRSAVVCFICVMLLTSSTYAWYSELAPSDGNDDRPQVEFHWTDTYNAPLEKWESVELFGANDGSATTEVMFDYDKWEPGHAQVRYLEFEVKQINNAITYEIIGDREPLVGSGDPNLAQVIDVYYIDCSNGPVTRAKLESTDPVGTLAQLCVDPKVTIKRIISSNDISDPVRTALVLKMRESAGNTYQGCQYGFKLTFRATENPTQTN